MHYFWRHNKHILLKSILCFPVRRNVWFKANMNSDIQLETAIIFFLSNIDLKQDIGYVYVMVDFIVKGLLEL